jgi:hypothetical protein
MYLIARYKVHRSKNLIIPQLRKRLQCEPYIAVLALLQLVVVASLILLIMHSADTFGMTPDECNDSMVMVAFATFRVVGKGRSIVEAVTILFVVAGILRRIDDCFWSRTKYHSYQRVCGIRVLRGRGSEVIKATVSLIFSAMFIVNTELLPSANAVRNKSSAWGFGQVGDDNRWSAPDHGLTIHL